MSRVYYGVTAEGRYGPPGTHEEACRWLDEVQPAQAEAMNGFNLSFMIGDPATTPGLIKHVRRYRNYLDIPTAWQKAGDQWAPGAVPPRWADYRRRQFIGPLPRGS